MGVERRKDGWYARVKGPDGVWRYEKLVGVRSRAEAIEEFAERARQAARQRRGLDPLTPNPKKLTLRQLMVWWLDRYCSDVERAKATNTVTVHILSSSIADWPLEMVTPGQVQRLLKEMRRSPPSTSYWRRVHDYFAAHPDATRLDAAAALGIAPSTVDRWRRKPEPDAKPLAALSPTTIEHVRGYLSRAFTAAIIEEHFVAQHPVIGRVPRPQREEMLPVWLTKDELRALLETTEPPMRWIFAVAALTGMRLGELCALRVDAVDFDMGLIYVRASHGRRSTKSKDQRVVPILVDARPHLEAAVAAARAQKSAYVFPGVDGERRHGHGAHFAAKLKRHLRLAGVEKQIRFHDLRDTFASLALQSGASLEAVRRALGHKDANLTWRKYGHLATDHIRDELLKLRLDDVAEGAVLEFHPRRGSGRR